MSANDDFILKLAQLLKYGADADGNPYTSTQQNPVWAPLDTDLTAYLELGCEVWNPRLGPAWGYYDKWAASPIGITEDYPSYRRQPEQYAKRTKEISDIVKPIFGTQCKIVLAGQIGGGPQERGLAYIDTVYAGEPSDYIDAIGVAPYACADARHFTIASTIDDFMEVLTNGNQIEMDGGALNTEVIPSLIRQRDLSQQYGIPLLGYEGGVSSYGIGTSSPINTMLWNAHHATRIGAILDQSYQAWHQYAGDTVIHQYTLIENTGTTKIGIDTSQYCLFFGALDQGNEIGAVKYDALRRNSLLAGDANCDGVVTLADFAIVSGNYGLGLSGSPSTSWWLSTDSPAWWAQGDFNNDQIVDMADFWLLYDNLSTNDRADASVVAFINSHPNPVLLPQKWATPIALTVTGNQGGITATTGHPGVITVTVDNSFGQAPAGPFVFNAIPVVNQPRHGTVTLSYPTITYTQNAGYSGIDDFWVSVRDTNTGLCSNKIWIPVNATSYPYVIYGGGVYPGGYDPKNAFDDDTETFFHSNASNGAYIGYDLGPDRESRVTQVKVLGRHNHEAYLTNGRFQGANNADFSDVVTLATITEQPATDTWFTADVAVTTRFRYLRFLAENGKYCMVAELKFVMPVVLHGGSVYPGGYEPEKAFDTDAATSFHSEVQTNTGTGVSAYVGYDNGRQKVVSQVKVLGRGGYEAYLQGGKIQGANATDFSDAVDLATVTAAPAQNTWFTEPIWMPTAFRNFRFLAPNGQYGAHRHYEELSVINQSLCTGWRAECGGRAGIHPAARGSQGRRQRLPYW